jgi:hypothetical protein
MQAIQASRGMSMVRPKPCCACGLEMFWDGAVRLWLCAARFNGSAVHRAQLNALRRRSARLSLHALAAAQPAAAIE